MSQVEEAQSATSEAVTGVDKVNTAIGAYRTVVEASVRNHVDRASAGHLGKLSGVAGLGQETVEVAVAAHVGDARDVAVQIAGAAAGLAGAARLGQIGLATGARAGLAFGPKGAVFGAALGGTIGAVYGGFASEEAVEDVAYALSHFDPFDLLSSSPGVQVGQQLSMHAELEAMREAVLSRNGSGGTASSSSEGHDLGSLPQHPDDFNDINWTGATATPTDSSGTNQSYSDSDLASLPNHPDDFNDIAYGGYYSSPASNGTDADTFSDGGGGGGGGNDGGMDHSSYGGSNDVGSFDSDRGGLFWPVVMDLDGDGADLVRLDESTAFFDANDDGFRNNIAWVGPGDGLLAYDIDGDGVIAAAEELAFVEYLEEATTDLEGLRAFDTNANGLLDGGDDEWARFGVWQDIDGDGQGDPGEFQGLEALGITTVELGSDGVVTELEDGSIVHGAGQFHRADGSIGNLLDVSLAYSDFGFRVDEGGVTRVRSTDGNMVGAGVDDVGRDIDLGESGFHAYLGGGGNDRLSAGSALNVLLSGGDGDDELHGGGGDDWLLGGEGADTLRGGGGHDVLFIDAEDLASGVVDGGDGVDVAFVEGDTGIDLTLSEHAVEAAFGSSGDDVLRAGVAAEAYLAGEEGDDTLIGGDGADTLIGGAGADRLTGGAGDDRLGVDADDVEIDGGDGIDTVFVTDSRGVDLQLGLASAEVFFGNSGDDHVTLAGATTGGVLDGGAGDDVLSGGDGDDLLVGGAGDDVLDGGEGIDTALYRGRLEDYRIDLLDDGGFTVTDSVSGALGDGTDRLFNVEVLNFADVEHTLQGAADDEGRWVGGEGDDLLLGTDGGDVLVSGKGDDIVVAGAGNDRVHAALGDDRVYGGAGDDLLHLGAGDDFGSGGDGDDHLNGLDGNDILHGDDGDDRLHGNAGNDILVGGRGNDVLWGGPGNDIFVFARGDGQDVVGLYGSDWRTAHDRLVFEDISHDELWFSRDDDDDVVIDVIGTTDQVSLGNWFKGPWNRVHSIETSDGYSLDPAGVHQLVNAMASFTRPDDVAELHAEGGVLQSTAATIVASWRPGEAVV